MVLPSLTSTILLTSMQRPSQITRPLPTTVPDSRPSRLKIRGSESTSTLTTLKSTTSPSDCELSSVLSWRPNPVPLDLTGSTTTYWNTSLRTHQRSSRRSWTSFGSLVISRWRAATVIPIPRPNKDHANPLSHRPIALTSCLCKFLEHMVIARFIWYLEKHGILDKSQCGFRKHHSTTDHLVSLERYVRDAFARKQQVVGLFFDLEKAYETTWQYGIICDLHRMGLRGRLPVFMSGYLRNRRIRVRIGNTLSDEF